MSNKWTIIILLLVSTLVHFVFFGHPAETVFDEVHFGKFVSGYYTGEYYFDVHPPLGKLMIAGFAKFFDFKPQYNFSNIGDKFPDNKYLALRFLPALAGTLLPLIIYFLVLELGMSRMAAFAGGLLVIFDNALLAQSRLILLDLFLLLFGFSSLLFYFKYRSNSSTFFYLLLSTFFAGLAISIKWTGLSFIALPVIIEAYRHTKKCLTNPSYTNFVRYILSFSKFASFLIFPIIIYFLVFAIHFALLPKSGSGDAFMSPSFRKTLAGNSYQNDASIRPANIFSKFIELNREMYRSNQRLGATHPYGSSWYSWPLMTRPIFYWVSGNSRIYFLGNPVVWWASAIAVATAIAQILKRKTQKKMLIFLVNGYVLNLLPFIGIKRVMFLYHYLTALIFAILILCYLIDQNPLDRLGARNNSRKIFTGIMVAAIAAFLFFAPLSYGLPLSDKAYSARVWFASWR